LWALRRASKKARLTNRLAASSSNQNHFLRRHTILAVFLAKYQNEKNVVFRENAKKDVGKGILQLMCFFITRLILLLFCHNFVVISSQRHVPKTDPFRRTQLSETWFGDVWKSRNHSRQLTQAYAS